jgi:CBS domain-containing protein
MNASEIMTASPCCCSPNDSLQDVARMMRDNDCGAVPVVENGCLVGIVTDRDLAIRALAEGKNASAQVSDVITRDPCCCDVSADLRDVEKIMADNQVRRVPVVDASGCCVGIIAQADLARAAHDGGRVSEHEVAIVVERISEPSRPEASRRAFERPADSPPDQKFWLRE